jgi:hypothetical protein
MTGTATGTATGTPTGTATGPALAPDHRLLLRAVLLDGAPARAAWQEWRASVDVDLVDEPTRRLLPLLARRLPDVAPEDPVRNLVKGMYRYAWVRNHLLWRTAQPVLDGLRDRGIATLLLKGIALVHANGDDLGARPMYDIDVLVPVERAGDAIEMLDELQWTPEQEQSAAWVRWRAVPRRHGWGFERGDGHLDLHWHVLGDSVGARADTRFWADARTVLVDGRPARVLDPAHLLLHVLAHGTRSLNAPAIQWVADAVTVVRAYGADPRFADRFAGEAAAQGLVTASRRALETIGDALGPALVDAPYAALDRCRDPLAARLAGAPLVGEPARQLARRAVGRTGLVRAATEVVRERLDLQLSPRPAVATVYALTRRPRALARQARRRGGSFVRTPDDAAPRIAAETELDFTRPSTLDAYGAVGWGRSEPGGATSRGAEPRLVLPLADELAGADLLLEVTLAARDRDQLVVITANEVPVARFVASVAGRCEIVRIPAAVAGAFAPLELAFRTRRGAVRLRLRHLRVTRVGAERTRTGR